MQIIEVDVSIVGLCEVGKSRNAKIAREHADHSNVSTETRVPMLDGKKKSANETDREENTPTKKCHDENTTALKNVSACPPPELFASLTKAAASSTKVATAPNPTNIKCIITFINTAATSGSGAESIIESVNK